jgi:hypothetical protein
MEIPVSVHIISYEGVKWSSGGERTEYGIPEVPIITRDMPDLAQQGAAEFHGRYRRKLCPRSTCEKDLESKYYHIEHAYSKLNPMATDLDVGPSSLPPHARPSPSLSLSRSRRSPSPANSLPESQPSHTIWLLIVLLLLVNLSTALYTLPLNRVIEIRLCQEHYALHDPSQFRGDGSIPEMLCKIDPVQRRLAWLQGVMEMTLVVCGMCVCAEWWCFVPWYRELADVWY